MACLLTAGGVSAGPELVAFPEDYKTTFTYVTTRDQHLGGNTVVDIYANYLAVNGANGTDPLANGSVMLMEAYSAKMGDDEQPLLDEQGRMIKDRFRAIVMMEKRSGWGETYAEELRSGEWEFGAFTTDGVARNRPITSCLECHKPLHELDYVYTYFELADIKAAMKE